jgi:hypothetical protein
MKSPTSTLPESSTGLRPARVVPKTMSDSPL